MAGINILSESHRCSHALSSLKATRLDEGRLKINAITQGLNFSVWSHMQVGHGKGIRIKENDWLEEQDRKTQIK